MLADILHKVAQLTYEDDQPYHPRPSLCSPAFEGAPGRCLRQMVYHRLATPARPLPGRAAMIFKDGHWHEDVSAEWIGKTGVRLHDRQLGVDIPLPQPLGTGFHCSVCNRDIPAAVMHGHIDGLLTDILGIIRLWEHKAVNHFSFQEMKKGEIPWDYVAQGCSYLRGIQLLRAEIRECLLLVKNKNTSAYLEYRFWYDAAADRVGIIEMVASDGSYEGYAESGQPVILDGILASAYGKFEEVEAYAATQTLPVRCFPMDDWHCDYCPFGGTCWDGIVEELAARQPIAEVPDLGTLLTRYAEGKHLRAQGEKTVNELRPKILLELETLNLQAGAANGLVARLRTQERSVLDEELLSPQARKAATRTKVSMILDVGADRGDDPNPRKGRRNTRTRTPEEIPA